MTPDERKQALREKLIRLRTHPEEFAEESEPTPEHSILTPAFDLALSAKREHAKRELCRRHLLPFVSRFNPTYDAGWVHKDICQRLERFSQDVVAKKSPRLMIFCPPRSGKSELVSRSFPAWHLGRNPTHEVIACSYSASLALKFSRKVRSVLRDPAYKPLFPGVSLDDDNQAAENWLLRTGGGYMAAGVSGPLTGNGMNVGIIDDPVKNRDEAESQNIREGIKDWYTSTFYTRLAPGAGILVIMTRWHDDDLAGWLLEQEKTGGDHWEVVKYAAIAESDEPYRKQGEALHPARYNLEALNNIRKAVGPRDWEALYQQNPVAEDGDYFKKEYIRYYLANQIPPLHELKTYTAWDLAIGTRDHNDFSVGITIGVDCRENLYVLDVIRVRQDAHELVEQILDAFIKWSPERVGIEKGHIEMAIGPFLNKRIRERRLFQFNYEGLKPGRQDKQARARSIQGRMQQGMVYFPAQAPWVQVLVNELLRFPNGLHDDQVDAMAWLGLMMDMFSIYVAKKPKSAKSWRDLVTRVTGTAKSHLTS